MDILRASFWSLVSVRYGIIGIGIFLRLRHFFENRSFWQDEICTALSIVNRSFAEIWHNVLLFPDFAQSPLFFNLISKSCVSLFGNSEAALRLPALVAGMASLFLAERLFRRCLTPFAATIALALFAISEPLVYFSSELKPYGTDVLATLLLVLAFLSVKDLWTWRRLVVLACSGAFAVWFSTPMVFVLAGCGFVLALEFFYKKDFKKVGILAAIYFIWLISFFVLYSVSLSKMLNPDLLKNWTLEGVFPPTNWLGGAGLLWLWHLVLKVFRSPLGLAWPGLMALFFAFGCYVWSKKDRLTLAFLIAPVSIVLLASVLSKYPFHERLILFLVPFLLIIFVSGVEWTIQRLSRFPQILSLFVLGVVFAFPIMTAGSHIIAPRGNELNREAMQYLVAHYRPGDMIAISPQAQYPFWYYGQQMGLIDRMPLEMVPGGKGMLALPVVQLFPNVTIDSQGRSLGMRRVLNVFDRDRYYRRFILMKQASNIMSVSETHPVMLEGMVGRVWVFLSHHNDKDYPSFVDGIFSSAGERLDHYEGPGVFVGLYQL